MNPNNPQLQRLLGASTRAPSRCAQLQFFGEYLHAFEDAFGHRNKDNEPINVNQGFGHAVYGHEPDKTYNHWGVVSLITPGAAGYWGNNESRTLEMEKEVFNKVRSTWGTTGKNQLTGNVITFTTIQSFLKTWNTIQDGNQKIDELNFKLAEFGFETIPPYNTNCAQAKRNEYVGGLNPSTYPGVILPAQQGAAGSAQQACGGSM